MVLAKKDMYELQKVFPGLKCSFLYLHQEKLTAFLKLESKIIDGTANNHLEELETCDDHGHNLWHSDSGSKGLLLFFKSFSPHGPERKVGVHQGVDKVVHGHEPSGAGGELTEAVEDIDEHRQVVIPATTYVTY